MAPFPFPAHQTGRADFPHPAFRPASLHDFRRRRAAPAPKTQHAEFPVEMLARKPTLTAPLHFVSSAQEAHRAIIDVAINGLVGRSQGAVAEVHRPTGQKPIELDAHARPGAFVTRSQQCADLRLDPLDAFLRRTGADIPSSPIGDMPGSDGIAKEIEAFAPGVTSTRFSPR